MTQSGQRRNAGLDSPSRKTLGSGRASTLDCRAVALRDACICCSHAASTFLRFLGVFASLLAFSRLRLRLGYRLPAGRSARNCPRLLLRRPEPPCWTARASALRRGASSEWAPVLGDCSGQQCCPAACRRPTTRGGAGVAAALVLASAAAAAAVPLVPCCPSGKPVRMVFPASSCCSAGSRVQGWNKQRRPGGSARS